MNILVFTPTFYPCRKGGIEKVVYKFYELDKLNFNNVYIITLSCNLERSTKLEVNNILYLESNYQKVEDIVEFDYLEYTDKVLTFIKTKEIDIIINHDWFLSDLAYNVNSQIKKPLISFIHSVKNEEYKNCLSEYQKKIHNKQLKVLKQSDEIICLTENVKKSISNLLNKDINISIIQCGMDRPKSYTYKIIKEKNIFTFYYHGRFANEKNIYNLLESFSNLDFESKLILRGDGKLKNSILRHIENLDLKDRVSILEWTSDFKVIQKDLLNSHVFVLPSYYEPLGLSILEATTMGVPSILPNNYGALEIYSKLKTGWLHSPLEPNSLKSSMDKAFKEYSFMKNKLKKSKWKCYDYYSWDNGYKQFQSVLNKVLL